jgi:hypothetical protein
VTTIAEPSTREWLSTHVFYASHPQPFLARCLAPLVAELREQDLLRGFFFINYWLEGPHVRVRLLPRSPEVADRVAALRDEHVARFLGDRPALYAVNEKEFVQQSYDVLFRLEFSPAERERSVDSSGQMVLQRNNTAVDWPYEPEFGRYGGPVGVVLSEEHFEVSSDLCLRLARQRRLQRRTHLLATAALLTTVLVRTFLPDLDDQREFLDAYEEHWRHSFHGTDYLEGLDMATPAGTSGQEVGRILRAADDLVDRAAGRDPAGTGADDEEDSVPLVWARHCRDLERRVRAAAGRGELEFVDHEGSVRPDARDSLERLLFSYVHMTNNRLHVLISDEVYLTRLLRTAFAGGPG